MGFFKDFREDLSQAVNEMLPNSSSDNAELETEEEFTEPEKTEVNTIEQDVDVAEELVKLNGFLEDVREDDEIDTDDTENEEATEDAATPQDFYDAVKAFESGEASIEESEPELDAFEETNDEAENTEPLEEETTDNEDIETYDESFEVDTLEEETESYDEADDSESYDEIEDSGDSYDENTGSEETFENDIYPVPESGLSTEGMDDMLSNDTFTKEDEFKEEDNVSDFENDVLNDEIDATEETTEAANDFQSTSTVGAEATDEEAIITKGMTITGDIETAGSVEVSGTIKGNVKCNGKIVVTGAIEGNSEASEFFADSARVEGEIKTTGTVKIGHGSVIIGNITATSAVIAGAIKGNIDVQGPVVVDTSAVVMGDIKSRSVQINNGAVIEGHCSQSYSDLDVNSLFN